MILRKDRELSLNLFIMLMILVPLSLTQIAVAQSGHQAGPVYIPQRVYNSQEKRFTDFESMLVELSQADVAFVGEQHNDPATHRLERAILEGLARRRSNIVVAMEMFERDVQKSLDEYLAGRLSEEEFLSKSRPWPDYLTDYRPLVEFSRFRGWRVVASNVPRPYASQVSRQGLGAVEAVSADERKLIAAQIQCPFDEYFNRFSEIMNRHPGADGGQADQRQNDEQRAMTERFYYAQCIKDETMAESVTNQLQPQGASQQQPLVVHFNGAFHSDYRLGTAARTSRRLPKSKIKVVTIIPVDDLDALSTDEYRTRGDYVLFTLRPTKIANN